MKRKLLWALFLIAVVVIVLILNTGGVASISLGFLGTLSARLCVVYGLMVALGLGIGLLLN